MAVKPARTDKLRPRAVEVHIEELMLEGVAPGECHRISEAVQRELSRLLARKDGLPAAWGQEVRVDRIEAGVIKLSRETSRQALGLQVARAVHRGLGR